MKPVRAPIPVLSALSAACRAYPDQRVAQVIVNALGTDPFHVDDITAADLLSKYAQRAHKTA